MPACAHRFLQGGKVMATIRDIFSMPDAELVAPYPVEYIQFNDRPRRSSFDGMLIAPGRKVGIEIQAVSFSGHAQDEIEVFRQSEDPLPFPTQDRHLDPTSATYKRLSPQLRVKMECLRYSEDGKIAIVVDRTLFDHVGPHDDEGLDATSCDIAWIVVELLDTDHGSADLRVCNIHYASWEAVDRQFGGVKAVTQWGRKSPRKSRRKSRAAPDAQMMLV